MTTLTWDEAFHQLWAQAAQHRGVNVDPLPGQISDSATQGWPRTHGWDVLAIAAVVDPVVRTLPMEPGSFGIERRWRHCATDLAELALDRPNDEFPQNRAFWATLAATLAYLASVDAPVPHDLWRALLAEIATPGEWRDLDRDDYLYLSADSYEELWRAQKVALSQLRGIDVREPSDDMSDLRMIPRTTHRDVLQLANFWTLALIKAEGKRPALGPDALGTLGLDGVRRRWQAVLADLDAHAIGADPRDIYPRNHEFWSATAAVSVAITVVDTLPLGLHLAVARGAAERRNARTHEIQEATFDKTWTAQRDQLAKARGSDLRAGPGADVPAMQVPRTTNADILQLAAYWQRAWTQLEDARKRGEAPDGTADPQGLVDERTRWQAAMADVDPIAKAGNPRDVYPRNDAFWRASRSLATTLGVFHQQPTPTQLLIDGPEDAEKSLPERLLELAKELPGQIADAAGAVAHAVNDIGREAGAGFFGGLGGPLLAGAGGLLVLWLLLRRRDPCEDE